MVLDAPDLVMPLLKRDLSLSRSGITTEGIDAESPHPQPGDGHAEELASIHIGLWELLCHCEGSPYCHPLSCLGSMSPSFITAPLPAPEAL